MAFDYSKYDGIVQQKANIVINSVKKKIKTIAEERKTALNTQIEQSNMIVDGVQIKTWDDLLILANKIYQKSDADTVQKLWNNIADYKKIRTEFKFDKKDNGEYWERRADFINYQRKLFIGSCLNTSNINSENLIGVDNFKTQLQDVFKSKTVEQGIGNVSEDIVTYLLNDIFIIPSNRIIGTIKNIGSDVDVKNTDTTDIKLGSIRISLKVSSGREKGYSDFFSARRGAELDAETKYDLFNSGAVNNFDDNKLKRYLFSLNFLVDETEYKDYYNKGLASLRNLLVWWHLVSALLGTAYEVTNNVDASQYPTILMTQERMLPMYKILNGILKLKIKNIYEPYYSRFDFSPVKRADKENNKKYTKKDVKSSYMISYHIALNNIEQLKE